MKQNLILLFLLLFLTACSTQQHINSEYKPIDELLYHTINRNDSLMFEAFNNRDLNLLKIYFDPNIEVIQDNIGVRNYEQTIASFEELFKKDYVLTRKLIKNSMEVYPIKNYGAIQTGKHTFCHLESGKLECATFKFVMIWTNINNSWKITRIITYDH